MLDAAQRKKSHVAKPPSAFVVSSICGSISLMLLVSCTFAQVRQKLSQLEQMMEVAQHMRELDTLMGTLQRAGTEGEEGELAERALALAAERLRCVFEWVSSAMNLRSRPLHSRLRDSLVRFF
jgi:hypothetical protein